VNGFRPLWRIPGIVARERRHPAGRQRIPESMVMNDPESVAQFHAAGASNPGIQAVYWKPAAGAGAPSPLGRHTPLPGAARRDAALLRWAFSA
jgi:tRNA (cmo5U34)-methyltransferase